MDIYCIAKRHKGLALLKLVRIDDCLVWWYVGSPDSTMGKRLIKEGVVLDVKRTVKYYNFDGVSNFLESDLESPYVNL